MHVLPTLQVVLCEESDDSCPAIFSPFSHPALPASSHTPPFQGKASASVSSSFEVLHPCTCPQTLPPFSPPTSSSRRLFGLSFISSVDHPFHFLLFFCTSHFFTLGHSFMHHLLGYLLHDFRLQRASFHPSSFQNSPPTSHLPSIALSIWFSFWQSFLFLLFFVFRFVSSPNVAGYFARLFCVRSTWHLHARMPSPLMPSTTVRRFHS